MGFRARVVDLLESLYEFNSMLVRVGGEKSKDFQVEQAVRQGCILSPQLFNIYDEHIIPNTLEHWPGGISIGGRTIYMCR